MNVETNAEPLTKVRGWRVLDVGWIVHSMLHRQERSWHGVKHDRGNWDGANKKMDVNIVWCVRDMRSNVRTVCMLYIVYAVTRELENSVSSLALIRHNARCARRKNSVLPEFSRPCFGRSQQNYSVLPSVAHSRLCAKAHYARQATVHDECLKRSGSKRSFFE